MFPFFRFLDVNRTQACRDIREDVMRYKFRIRWCGGFQGNGFCGSRPCLRWSPAYDIEVPNTKFWRITGRACRAEISESLKILKYRYACTPVIISRNLHIFPLNILIRAGSTDSEYLQLAISAPLYRATPFIYFMLRIKMIQWARPLAVNSELKSIGFSTSRHYLLVFLRRICEKNFTNTYCGF